MTHDKHSPEFPLPGDKERRWEEATMDVNGQTELDPDSDDDDLIGSEEADRLASGGDADE